MAANLPRDFHLERYFAVHEFSAPYLLSSSDVESVKVSELLELADPECKALWNDLKLSYTESAGHPLLREEAAKLHGVTADETLIVVPQEGIYIAMKCLISFLQKKHHLTKISVVTTFPAYQSLYENADSMGCEVRHWTSYLDKGWQFNIADLKSKVTDDTKLLVVNFPHNPTGFVPTVDEWNEIITFCKEKDIFLFSDEMYRFSNNDGESSLPSASSLYSNSISLSGLSKTFALPGLRLGWLCTQNREVMKMMVSFKDYITICGVAPGEILGIIALRNVPKLLERTLKIVNNNLDLLDDFFSKYKDIFDWTRPSAGTATFVKLKGWLLSLGSGGASGFCERLIGDSGIMVVPAKCFEFDDQYVRIGFGYTSLPTVLEQLAKFLDSNKPKET